MSRRTVEFGWLYHENAKQPSCCRWCGSPFTYQGSLIICPHCDVAHAQPCQTCKAVNAL